MKARGATFSLFFLCFALILLERVQLRVVRRQSVRVGLRRLAGARSPEAVLRRKTCRIAPRMPDTAYPIYAPITVHYGMEYGRARDPEPRTRAASPRIQLACTASRAQPTQRQGL